jgi:hypothetical protein
VESDTVTSLIGFCERLAAEFDVDSSWQMEEPSMRGATVQSCEWSGMAESEIASHGCEWP